MGSAGGSRRRARAARSHIPNPISRNRHVVAGNRLGVLGSLRQTSETSERSVRSLRRFKPVLKRSGSAAGHHFGGHQDQAVSRPSWNATGLRAHLVWLAFKTGCVDARPWPARDSRPQKRCRSNSPARHQIEQKDQQWSLPQPLASYPGALCSQFQDMLLRYIVAWVPRHGMAPAAGAAFIFAVNRPHH